MKKSTAIPLTVRLTSKDYEALKKLSAKTDRPMAVISREFISEGMAIEKTKDDINFIRKQIREEVESVMVRRMERIIKLLIKIGMMVYPVAYYNTMLAKTVAEERGLKHKDYMERAKQAGARELGVAMEAVDALYDEITKFNL